MTTPPLYQSRFFSLSLPHAALSETSAKLINQRLGLELASELLQAIKVAAIVSWPLDSVAVATSDLAQNDPQYLWLSYYLNFNNSLGIDSESDIESDLGVESDSKASKNLKESLFELLDWQGFVPEAVRFTDYLWEQNCLECFIGGQGNAYIEINASPSGQYAVYQFDGYRSPNVMPPRPLDTNLQPVPLNPKAIIHTSYSQQLKSAKFVSSRAHIQWQPDGVAMPHHLQSILKVSRLFNINNSATLSDALDTMTSRHFRINLSQLPETLLPVSYIHPCVILYLAGQPLYFAPRHASEPDFHDKHYWTKLSD